MVLNTLHTKLMLIGFHGMNYCNIYIVFLCYSIVKYSLWMVVEVE